MRLVTRTRDIKNALKKFYLINTSYSGWPQSIQGETHKSRVNHDILIFLRGLGIKIEIVC
jgi:hypothetical protein